MNYKCKICGNQKNNNKFKIREMMYDLGEYFDYIECSRCGTLQIKENPKDMSKYGVVKLLGVEDFSRVFGSIFAFRVLDVG